MSESLGSVSRKPEEETMITLPPDGRQEIGQRIEGLVHGLDSLVTQYLNMVSLADRPKAIAKVRATVRAYPVLAITLDVKLALHSEPESVDKTQDRKRTPPGIKLESA